MVPVPIKAGWISCEGFYSGRFSYGREGRRDFTYGCYLWLCAVWFERALDCVPRNEGRMYQWKECVEQRVFEGGVISTLAASIRYISERTFDSDRIIDQVTRIRQVGVVNSVDMVVVVEVVDVPWACYRGKHSARTSSWPIYRRKSSPDVAACLSATYRMI